MPIDASRPRPLPSKGRIARRVVLGGLVTIVSTIPRRSGQAAPTARLWDRWVPNDPSSQIVVDHGVWRAFLRRYLVEEPDGISRLRYADVSTGDREALRHYL